MNKKKLVEFSKYEKKEIEESVKDKKKNITCLFINSYESSLSNFTLNRTSEG